MMPACGSCRFGRPTELDGVECRKGAPHGPRRDTRWTWPVTHREDFCGEHRATPIAATAGEKDKVFDLLVEALVETTGLLVDVAPGEQPTIQRAQVALALAGRGLS